MAIATPRPFRKRPRPEDDLDSLLARAESCLSAAASDAGALLLAAQRLQQLQAGVEQRLGSCHIDSLTPHEAVEFIYRRRVRLTRIWKNDFEEPDSDDDKAQASGAGGAERPSEPPQSERKLVAHFQIGKERLVITCTAERRSLGMDARYSMEVQSGGEDLLSCCSWDQASTKVNWQDWEALRCKFALDRRPVFDFARGVVLLGLFTALRAKFARQESDSEDEAPGLVSTLSICGMMAGSLFPTAEERLLKGREAALPDSSPEQHAQRGAEALPPLARLPEAAASADDDALAVD